MLGLAGCGGGSGANSDVVLVSGNAGLGASSLESRPSLLTGAAPSMQQAPARSADWTPSSQLRSDVSRYKGQLGPKAFAITPPTDSGAQAWGSIHGAASTQEAQSDALQVCQNVAAQKGIGLSCSLLYIEDSRQPLNWL